MKTSRDFLLLGSVVALLAAGTALYWSSRQVEHLTAAGAEFAQTRTTHRAALGEATARIGQLKAQLVEVRRGDRVPPSYEEWSRLQVEARAAIAALRQRLADLAPSPTSPIPAQPGLVATSDRLRILSTRLLADWRAFEERGSGLTPPSRDFASTQLLPLLIDELQPALDELTAAERADADAKALALPRLLRVAHLIRLAAATALVGLLGALGYAQLKKSRSGPPLLVKAREKLAGGRPAEIAESFEKDAATMAPTQLKVLVAVQNPAASDTLALLLTNAGYAVIGCDSSQSARDALKTLPFALVLLDFQLPDKGGVATLAEARRRHPRLPAILLCNAEDDARRFESKTPAVTEVVRRPFNPRTLLWTISEILYPGENRESREYSPYVPEPDDAPPAEAPPLAAPGSEPEAPAPTRRPPSTAPAASVPPVPARVPLVPRPTFSARTPQDEAASSEAPAAAPPLEPPPRPPRRPAFILPPPPAPPPERRAPDAPVPESADPATELPGNNASTEPDPNATSPAFPRKKMVRRKILPSE